MYVTNPTVNDNAIFCLLSKTLDNSSFEQELEKLLKSNVNINYINNGGHTVLDTANFFGTTYKGKAKILADHGAKTAKDLGFTPKDIHEKIMRPYDSMTMTGGYVKEFDFDSSDQLTVVDYYLTEIPSTTSSSSDKISVRDMLNKYKGCIGQLIDNEDEIGTVFLIANSLIMVSRHCLNGLCIGELSVLFKANNDSIVKIKGLVEDGTDYMLDYAILLLETSITDVHIPQVSNNNKPTHSLFMGYDNDGDLCFSNFTNQTDEYESVATSQTSYQETDAGMSGSPYFDETGVYALHQNTSHDNKGSLFIETILTKNNDSVLHTISKSVKIAHTCPQEPFKDFTLSTQLQWDEGNDRSATLGKNPSIGNGELGGKDTNLVCREVLYRWALRGKAKLKIRSLNGYL